MTRFTEQAGVELPLVCGAMYPCSNPELVAAVSEAGGIGIVQPISLTYVHGHDFREGLRFIKRLTSKPIGMNALIEKSSAKYQRRMAEWVDIAIDEGIRFFVTSLGKPDWVARRVHAAGGFVYHDVTEKKWAEKGADGGVDGFIAVNNRAGGHAGGLSAEALYDELKEFGKPVLCAGGIAAPGDLSKALHIGYDGVQIGTRFIATEECTASEAYKQAIIDAAESDIVLSERITGVPVSVINTPYIERTGTKAGPIAQWMLRHGRTKHWMRTIYALKSLYQLKRSNADTTGRLNYWQAGKGVGEIHEIAPVAALMEEFRQALAE